MSSLPPVGKPLIDGAEAEDRSQHFGRPEDQSHQFGKGAVERRRGRVDRRAAGEDPGGGRRVGEADRRLQAQETATQDVQTSGDASEGKQPVHLEDDQGRVQPNPKSPVTGVSDIDRLQDAVRKGVPLGTVEMEQRGVPASGVPVVHHVKGETTERESGTVRAGMGEVDNSEAEKPADTSEGWTGQWQARRDES